MTNLNNYKFIILVIINISMSSQLQCSHEPKTMQIDQFVTPGKKITRSERKKQICIRSMYALLAASCLTTICNCYTDAHQSIIVNNNSTDFFNKNTLTPYTPNPEITKLLRGSEKLE